MTKPRTKTFEELTAEIEDGKKKIRQFENREKMLRQKLSKEERRTRSHRLIVRGAVFESIVPEAKGMTNEKSATFLLLLCHVYFSFFQALNLNFPVIQTESYSAIFFHFLILVLNVPNGATVLTCINLYTSQTAVLVASSAHFLIWGSNNSSSLNESIIS